MKTISEFQDGDDVRAFVMLSGVQKKTSGDGRSTRWTATVADSTGTVEAVDWDGEIDGHENGPAAITGVVSSYHDKLQLKITRYRIVDPEADAAHGFDMDLLIRASRFSEAELMERLANLRAHLSEPAAAAWDMVLEIHGDRFMLWPAATRNHHAFRRGLLEHVVHMGELVVSIADVYTEQLDVDVLLLGVLTHDIGKLEELEEIPGGEWTTAGHLIGHIPFGFRMWTEAAHLADYPDAATDHVSHLILSHHGLKEWGSPVTPATPEAVVLHQVDMLDSRIAMLREATRVDPARFARSWKTGAQVWNLAALQEADQ